MKILPEEEAGVLLAEVHVEIRPVEMICMWPLDVENLRDRRAGKPGELLKRDEQLSTPEEEPEPLPRYVDNFNLRSACAKLVGSHPAASPKALEF